MFEEHRLIIKETDEHLLDGTASEFHGEDFTHTDVDGVYDPAIDPNQPDGSRTIELGGEGVTLPVYEGDGVGQLHSVEPMITTDFVSNDLDEEMAVDIATPEAFPVADDYPTETELLSCRSNILGAIPSADGHLCRSDGLQDTLPLSCTRRTDL